MVKYDLTTWQYTKGWPVDKRKRKILGINKKISSIESSDLNEIKGVWEETIKLLIEAWIYSQDDLIKSDSETIKSIKLWFLSRRGITNFIKDNKK